MPSVGKRFPYLGDNQSINAGIIPSNFTGTDSRDDLNISMSPGVTWVSASSSWGSAIGTPNQLMTSPILPAPYTVTGQQPSNDILPSTAVAEWDMPAWNALSTNTRAYLNTYANNFGGGPSSSVHRKEVLVDTTTLREPRRVIYGGPSRRIGSYAIRSAFNGREPLGWNLKGGNSPTGPWTTLDTRNHTVGNLTTNPLMNATQATFTVPDLSLVPLGGFTHYMLEFTKVYPVGTSQAGYIDLLSLVFYEVGFRMQSTPRRYPGPVSRAAFSVRLIGRPSLRADEVAGYASRETALANWKPLSFYIAGTMADNSIIMVGECDLSEQAAQNQVAVRLNVPYNDVRVAGWSFGAAA